MYAGCISKVCNLGPLEWLGRLGLICSLMDLDLDSIKVNEFLLTLFNKRNNNSFTLFFVCILWTRTLRVGHISLNCNCGWGFDVDNWLNTLIRACRKLYRVFKILDKFYWRYFYECIFEHGCKIYLGECISLNYDIFKHVFVLY